jgi:hypothetical protein
LFRKKILEYTSIESLTYIIHHDNFVLLSVADNKHLLFLEVPQLIELEHLMRAVFSNPKELV